VRRPAAFANAAEAGLECHMPLILSCHGSYMPHPCGTLNAGALQWRDGDLYITGFESNSSFIHMFKNIDSYAITQQVLHTCRLGWISGCPAYD
jgi:hypothetical protein